MSSKANPARANIPCISPFKHRNNSKPLPGENPPQSQSASFYLSLFLVLIRLSQEGFGQIPPAHAEFAILRSLLCDSVRFAGGEVGEPTVVPAALCASCRVLAAG